MTEPSTKQKEVFTQVNELLSEHFDSYVLVVETEINHPDSGEAANFWRGAYKNHSTAIGLLVKQKAAMLERKISSDE